MTRDGELATRDYVASSLAGAEHETDIGVMQSLTRQALRALEIYADPAWAPEGYAALADAALRALRRGRARLGPPAGLGARAARRGPQRRAHSRSCAACSTAPSTLDGLAVDDDLRWAIVQALSARGAIGADDDRRRARARPVRRRAAPRAPPPARCSRPPRPRPRRGGWPSTTTRCPTRCRRPCIAGFAHSTQGELVAPYAARYFDEVADVWERRTSELAQNVVVGLFPTWTSTIDAATRSTLADAFLADRTLPSALRRLVQRGPRRRRCAR